jgi:hypothetical protein
MNVNPATMILLLLVFTLIFREQWKYTNVIEGLHAM